MNNHDVARKVKTTLRQAFNEAAAKQGGHPEVVYVQSGFGKPRPLPDIRFEQPPVTFEERANVQGFAHHYTLPPGLVARELQEYGMMMVTDKDTVQQKLADLWACLKKDNPDTLGQIKFDERDGMNLYHAILGVASAFPPADIQFWLDGNLGSTVTRDPKLGPMLEKVTDRYGNIGWVPSEKTMQKLLRQPKPQSKAPGA